MKNIKERKEVLKHTRKQFIPETNAEIIFSLAHGSRILLNYI